MVDASANLFGAIALGGASNTGTIFEFVKGGGITVLANFNGTNGTSQIGDLLLPAKGLTCPRGLSER